MILELYRATKFKSAITLQLIAIIDFYRFKCLFEFECSYRISFDSPPQQSLHRTTGTPCVKAAAHALPPLTQNEVVAPPSTIVAAIRKRGSSNTARPRGHTVRAAIGCDRTCSTKTPHAPPNHTVEEDTGDKRAPRQNTSSNSDGNSNAESGRTMPVGGSKSRYGSTKPVPPATSPAKKVVTNVMPVT